MIAEELEGRGGNRETKQAEAEQGVTWIDQNSNKEDVEKEQVETRLRARQDEPLF